jgi:peptide/nickel transport system permease protein
LMAAGAPSLEFQFETVEIAPSAGAIGSLRLALSTWTGRIGFGIVMGFLVIAVLAPVIARQDPLFGLANAPFVPPNSQHWFGTDEDGRDLFARIVFGTRYDLLIALGAASLGAVLGTLGGSFLGYYGGPVDDIAMRIVDAIQAFPAFILAMGVVAAVGGSVLNLIFIITFVQIAPYVRMLRAQARTIRSLDYVDAARVVGLSGPSIVLRHVIPNLLPTAIVQASASTAYAILTVAGLSFVGLGIAPPTPEWGSMVNNGMPGLVTGTWWVPLFPAVTVMIAVLGFNLVGDSMQDLIAVRKRV